MKQHKYIGDIGFVQHIQKPVNAKKIPVVVYEELKVPLPISMLLDPFDIKWFESVPYKVTVV